MALRHRLRIKKHNVYEVTVLGNFGKNRTVHATGTEVLELFGRDPATEALNGYSPNVIIVEL